MLSNDVLLDNSLFREVFSHYERKSPGVDREVLKHSVLREMLSIFVNDLIKMSLENFRKVAASSNLYDGEITSRVISFSAQINDEHLALKKLLFENLYRHPKIQKNNEQAKQIVYSLFNHFTEKPELMGETNWSGRETADEEEIIIQVADYIAGMTDRFAVASLNGLYDHQHDPAQAN